jgi:hypothetical protein
MLRIRKLQSHLTYVILGYCREVLVNEKLHCLCCYAAGSCNYLPTFRETCRSQMQGGLVGCAETLVRNYHYSLRNSTEERISHTYTYVILLIGLNIHVELNLPSEFNFERVHPTVFILMYWIYLLPSAQQTIGYNGFITTCFDSHESSSGYVQNLLVFSTIITCSSGGCWSV